MRTPAIFLILFAVLFCLGSAQSAHAITDTYTASGTWTAPSGVTSVSVEGWGAGGGGDYKGGGGGGAYSADSSMPVTPGQLYSVTVGTGGTGNRGATSPTSGGSSSFASDGGELVLAPGGSAASGDSGGAGGAAGSGSGVTKYSGGSGGSSGFATAGSGGGSSAGTGSNGNDGTAAFAGFGGPGGTAPTGGAAGGAGGNSGLDGSNGSNYGGGGGGDGGGGVGAGNGAGGKITITYSAAPDTDPPTVSTFFPPDNGTNASITTNLVITFNETVTAVSSKDLTIKKTSDDSTVETISVTGGQVTGSGSNIITIDPSVTLANSTSYYVLIDAGAFEDGASNDFAGIASTTTWNFTTTAAGDVTAPTVSSLSPADNATGVSMTSNLVITFSESVTAVASKNLTIKKTSDDSTVETISVTGILVSGSGTDTITINPATTLADSTEYYILIDSGAFVDGSSNAYAGIASTTTWNFTTIIEVVAPRLSTFTSTTDDGTYGPGGNITIIATYSETLRSDSTITVVLDSGKKVTLDTVSGTTLRGTYEVGETGSGESSDDLTIASIFSESVYDVNANRQTESRLPEEPNNFGDSTKIAVDTTAPTVTSLVPADNATSITSTANLVVTFSEPINIATGSIVIRRTSTNGVLESISVLSSRITKSGGNKITINPVSDLAGDSDYYVQIPSTAFVDPWGNFYAGITDKVSWNFATTGIVTPVTDTSVVATPQVFPSNLPPRAVSDLVPFSTLPPEFSEDTLSSSSSSPEPEPSRVTIPPTNTPSLPTSSWLETFVNSAAAKVTLGGVTAAAVVSLLVSSSVLLTNIFSQASQRIWQGILGLFGFSKNKRPWGRVLDADTGDPIAGAYVQVYDHQFKQLKNTLVSNDRGAFSLLVPPGTYEFRVQKPGWVLTPQATYARLVAGERVYNGSAVTVTTARILPIVLAMRAAESIPLSSQLIWRKIFQGVTAFISLLSWPLLLFGAGLSTLVLFASPTNLNIAIEALYVILIVWKIVLRFIIKPATGYVRDAITKKPLDLAVVRLYNAENGHLLETRTTSYDGKFLILPPLGVYTIMVVHAGYESYRESHVVVNQKKESLALSFMLKPLEGGSAEGGEANTLPG